MITVQKCRVCGCTQDKINESCVQVLEINGVKDFVGCYWAEEDLCSGCVTKN